MFQNLCSRMCTPAYLCGPLGCVGSKIWISLTSYLFDFLVVMAQCAVRQPHFLQGGIGFGQLEMGLNN